MGGNTVTTGTDRIRLGTRGSALALAQARAVADQLRRIGIPVEVSVIRTEGDRLPDARLAAVGAKGLFVREIEEALLAGTVDAAVHSLKDLPVALPRGLVLAACLERGDPRDVIVTRAAGGFDGLPEAGTIGTSSPRRRALALRLRPDLIVEPLRGNVDTRLRRLEGGGLDAVVVGAAGLDRLGIVPVHAEPFRPDVFIPAAGQGIIAVEARADEVVITTTLRVLDHPLTHLCALAERSFLRRLGASCATATGAYARAEGQPLHMAAVILSADGGQMLRESVVGWATEPEQLGWALAEALLARGAAGIAALEPSHAAPSLFPGPSAGSIIPAP